MLEIECLTFDAPSKTARQPAGRDLVSYQRAWTKATVLRRNDTE
jgi:hypothetical protein